MKEHLKIANSFFRDAVDLLARYDLTARQFWMLKSRRVKLFVDLRVAYECILKAYVAYFTKESHDRKTQIQKVESFRHDIGRLLVDVIPSLPEHLVERGRILSKELARLPISLRYYLDADDFLDAKEEHYYETIGNDRWIAEFADFVRTLVHLMDKHLQAHSRIVAYDELADSIDEETYN